MDYSIYVDKILENMGRGPDEIAFKFYKKTYKEIITSLISTDNMQDAAYSLGLPKHSIKGLIDRGFKDELPDKNGKSSWKVVLLYSLGLAKCPICNIIFNIDNKNKFAIAKAHYECNDCIVKRQAIYLKNNPTYNSEYYHANRNYFREKEVLYRNGKQQRVPSWANLDKIKEIYNNCPKGYHVDHIVPLHGTNVSGLHVENNLQYLLAKDNLSKGNKFDLELAT